MARVCRHHAHAGVLPPFFTRLMVIGWSGWINLLRHTRRHAHTCARARTHTHHTWLNNQISYPKYRNPMYYELTRRTGPTAFVEMQYFTMCAMMCLIFNGTYEIEYPPPPPPLSCPTPGKTVPRHPLGDGCQVTVPHPPWGTVLPSYTHIFRCRNCTTKRKN